MFGRFAASTESSRAISLALIVVLVVSAALASACGSSQKQVRGPSDKARGTDGEKPSWVEQAKHPEYPDSMYIVGVGSGMSRRKAYASALAEVVFQVKTTVNAKFESTTTQQIESKDGAENVSSNSKRERNVELKSNFKTEGLAELADHWVDQSSEVHYVFAVVDRTKARSFFKDKYNQKLDSLSVSMEELQRLLGDEQQGDIQKAAAGGDGEKSHMRRIATMVHELSEARTELRELELLVRIFDGRVDSGNLDTVLKKGKSRLSKMRNKMAFAVCVDSKGRTTSDDTSYLRSKVKDWLSQRGIEAKPCNATLTAEYSVRLNASLDVDCNAADNFAKVTMCRTSAMLEVKQADANQVMLSQPLGGEETREGRRRRAQAARASMDQVATEMSKHLQKLFGS